MDDKYQMVERNEDNGDLVIVGTVGTVPPLGAYVITENAKWRVVEYLNLYTRFPTIIVTLEEFFDE